AAVLAFASGAAVAGGDIIFDPQDKRPAAAAPARKAETGNLFSNTWIGDLVSRLIAGEPTPASRADRVAKPRAKPKPTQSAAAAPAMPLPPKPGVAANPPAQAAQPKPAAAAAPAPAPVAAQPKDQIQADATKPAPPPPTLTSPAEAAPI